jgi:hypothetical protein
MFRRHRKPRTTICRGAILTGEAEHLIRSI